jgi:hypothetical protein
MIAIGLDLVPQAPDDRIQLAVVLTIVPHIFGLSYFVGIDHSQELLAVAHLSTFLVQITEEGQLGLG